MTINECLIALERDRREPDKTLLNLASLRRALSDLRNMEGVTPEIWNALYVEPPTWSE